MMNFNRDRRGSRSPREMFKAVCASCGQSCDVPFRPSGDRPVYCSRCFDEKGRPDSRSSGGLDLRRSDFRDRSERRDRYDRNDRSDRQMFDAICDKCGSNCTVPFQPTSGKPIFCSKCFEEKNDRNPRNSENYKEHFIALNHKLDKILRILEPVVLEEEILEIPEPKILPVKAQAKKAKAKKAKPAVKTV